MAYTKTIRIRGSRAEVKRRLKQALRDPKMKQLLMAHVAHHLVTKIHRAYVVKSEGRTDELGNRWTNLKRSTIASRPITAGDRKGIPRNRTHGLLSPQQDKQWRAIFRNRLIYLMAHGVPPETAKIKAAQAAWAIMKSKGAVTRLQKLGGRKVPIMIDSGRLERSLRPGRLTRWSYAPYNRDQQVEASPTEIRIRSLVPYAEHASKKRPIIPSARKMAAHQRWVPLGLAKGARAVVDHLASQLR
jgi:hypothetical protein